MKKLLKIGLILFGVGIFAAGGTYMYVFHKPHRNVAKEKPAYVLDAEELYSEFATDEVNSYEKYGDQVIQITGQIAEVNIEKNNASLAYIDPLEGVSCSFDSLTTSAINDQLTQIQIGDRVTVKGKCDGYDMIMGVVLTRCILVGRTDYIAKAD